MPHAPSAICEHTLSAPFVVLLVTVTALSSALAYMAVASRQEDEEAAPIHFPSENPNKVFGRSQSFIGGHPTNVQLKVKR